MQKKSSGGSTPRIPPEHCGIQVNFCKNPECENYGIAAAQYTGRGAQRDRYAIVSAGRQYPVLKCRACGEYPPLKSNQGIAEERERLGAYLRAPPEASCPDADCANHGVGVSTGSPNYRSYGTTRSGSKRYRCNACTKTFSIGYSTVGQKQPHKNRLIFELLMNKSPFRRLCEIAEGGSRLAPLGSKWRGAILESSKTRGSKAGRWPGLPADVPRVCDDVRRRCCLRSLPGAVALAGAVSLPSVWGEE